MRHFFILLFITISATISLSQEDPVLFYIEDNPVTISEFKYIYEKNNRDKADYSKESVEEYLDLYINFKLKVQKALEKEYHESDAYKNELAGYRNQLADSYIINREVINRIANQIYERSKTDIALRHILVPVPQNAVDEVINGAEEKIHSAYDAIKRGLTFEEAVTRHSLDLNSIPLGGDIGYISAPLPDGYVELENLAYTLNPGMVSPPVRTDLGFHIIKVADKRQARGDMEGQHLLIRKIKNGISPR